MKRNITINMFGILYAIDEDAYELLKRYLASMKQYFYDKEGGEEISDDIEHRVAELLWLIKEGGQEIITIEIVKDIIGKIGNPTEIDSTEETGTEKGKENCDNDSECTENTESKLDYRLKNWLKGRYLYRDPNDKILGGVCAGLAHFCGGGSATAWRLITTLLLFGSLCLGYSIGELVALPITAIYLVMWIIVPSAQTPEDYLRMRGEEVTPENINNEIINSSTKYSTEEYHPKRNSGGGCLSILLKGILIVLLLPFIILFGILLFCLFFIILTLAGFSSFMFPFWMTENMAWMQNYINGNAWTMITGIIAVTAVILIPVLALSLAATRNDKPVSAKRITTYTIMWIICVVIGILSFISIAMNGAKAEREYNSSYYQSTATANDTTTVGPFPIDSSEVDTIGWQE